MRNETKIRIANRNDIDGMVELQKPIYPEYNRDPPFFLWQCFENVNPSMAIVAQEDTSIVGTSGIQKRKTTGSLYGGQLSWLIVAEYKRGSGLFAKMGNFALECISGLDFIFVFANKNAVSPCEKTFGMKFIGSFSPLILKNNISESNEKARVEPITIETKFNKLTCYEEIVTFSRTENYRRWRYANSTVHKYFKVSISAEEYAIIKLFKKDQSSPTIGDIVDFECNVTDKNQLQHLFCSASFELRKMGATMIATWAVPKSELGCLLDEMGFEKSEYCSFFGVKMINKKCNQLYDFSKWHLVQSDASNY